MAAPFNGRLKVYATTMEQLRKNFSFASNAWALSKLKGFMEVYEIYGEALWQVSNALIQLYKLELPGVFYSSRHWL